MDKKGYAAMDRILKHAVNMNEGYAMHTLELDRLCHYIIEDVGTVLFYNRRSQSRANKRKTTESEDVNLYRNETASRAPDA